MQLAGDEAARIRALLRRQATHLARLLDDLLDVARISRGKITLRREAVDLRAVVDLAVESERHRIDAKRQRLRIALPPAPVIVDGDPARLQQVEDRLALIERLKRKYGPTLQDVIATGAALARERELLTDSEEAADDLDRALGNARHQYLELARDLSRRRRLAAKSFATQIETHLAQLAMARTRFEVLRRGLVGSIAGQ